MRGWLLKLHSVAWPFCERSDAPRLYEINVRIFLLGYLYFNFPALFVAIVEEKNFTLRWSIIDERAYLHTYIRTLCE